MKDLRAKRFFSSVLQSLPTSFLVMYILMLDLHYRVSEVLLSIAFSFSFLAFAFGTAQFVGGNEDMVMKLVVLIQVFFQFFFRIFVVCAICVRFMGWGLFALSISWTIAYIFGPHGCFRILLLLRNPNANRWAIVAKLFLKILHTPLSFALVIDAKYETEKLSPSSEPRESSRPVMAIDCFHNHKFLLWRQFENCIFAVLFVVIPQSARGNDDYDKWLDIPLVVESVSLVSLIIVALTWVIIAHSKDGIRLGSKKWTWKSGSGYGEQMDSV
jgi:hypothetical protein